MQVLAEQRSEEWFKARLGIPTASRFSDVLAKNRSGPAASRTNYMAELVAQLLTGEREEHYTNKAMEWGVENEDSARLAYEFKSGEIVEETGLWIHDKVPAGASPDGLIGSDGVLEIKCPNTATHIATLFKGTLPSKYKAQAQGQMWVTGRQWCDFVSYDPRLPENLQLVIIRVHRDEDYIINLERELIKFTSELKELEERLTAFNK